MYSYLKSVKTVHLHDKLLRRTSVIKKTLKNLLLPIWILLAFSIGAILCLVLHEKIAPSGWAETTSAIATVIALSLAIITFWSWQHQKIRDDAYSTTKTYITTLVEIESTQQEIDNLFYSAIPAPGMIALSDEGTQRILDSIQQMHSELRLLTIKLISTRNELPFWGVSLSQKASSEHDTLIDTLGEYLNIAPYLYNCLVNIFIHKAGDTNIESWQSRLTKHSDNLKQSFDARKSLTAKSMFIF